MKTCRTCERELPLDSFYSVRRGDNEWYRSSCRQCHNRSRTKRNRASKYGLTVQQLDDLVGTRSCAICGSEVDAKVAHIDHSHETGIVRGLLCQWCNIGLGQFREDPRLLMAAMYYLWEHGVSVTWTDQT